MVINIRRLTYCYSHSLGAAQALLAGIDLYQREPRLNVNNLFIHTAGCPRVRDPVFAQYIDSTNLTYTQSVYKNDSESIYNVFFMQ